MAIYKEEIFGPVLSVVRSKSFDDAVNLVNANEYGNGVAIYTQDGDAARSFSNSVDVGMIGINMSIPVPLAFHNFGGSNRSKFGDTQMYGPESYASFTKVKNSAAPRQARITEGDKGRDGSRGEK